MNVRIRDSAELVRKTMNNSETKIIIAGFGGQGVVLSGNIIAQACMVEDKNATMMVSYGAEMRGGTANSTVVISEGEIASPFVERPNIAIILNRPSLDKFEPKMVPSGRIIMNTSLIDRDIERDDIDVAKIDATQIAIKLGNVRVANMVALGAFSRATGLLAADSIAKSIEEVFSEKKPALVDINIQALNAGLDSVVL